ncbi:MAG: hypothetical protein KJN93_04620 [Alphaproteobacteria bacterium]|nr:hypothetical protein [Alphaproteobacteria bacterium]NNF23861.1 hypothetical protein [Paracoccaceae bacterium]
MTDPQNQQKPFSLGVFARGRVAAGLSPGDIIALALSAVWLLAMTVFFFLAGSGDQPISSDPLRGVMIVVAVFMPIALIWIAASAANSARIVREDSARLHSAIDAMRQAQVSQRQAAGTAVKPSVEKKLDQIAAAQAETEAKLATFSSIRQNKPAIGGLGDVPPPPALAQASLALGIPPEDMAPPITVDDFIRAMNFPETADDKEGFRALRAAMKDRHASELIQSSQDVLTLLSQEGIYMDDLSPDRARPEIWRRFAHGERGRTVAALGGIRDRSGIALAAARMRQDHIFRDTAHHFLRKFDKVFAEFEKNATDPEIAALSDTRTARAFMLLGRVAGTFD